MAKEFKDWDKAFSKDEIDVCREEWLCDVMQGKDENDFLEWPDYIGYDASYTVGQIRYAVYEADDAAEWQLFRVSMKGLRTVEKLIMLGHRWQEKCDNVFEMNAKRDLELMRIHNYIGALKRGGQLRQNALGALAVYK